MRRSNLLVLGALVGFGLSPALAIAQNKPGPKAIKEADSRFKRGIKLASTGDYQLALAEFEEAYALAPHPLVLFNIAGAHRALKHYREALDGYSRFLLEGDGLVKSELLTRAKGDLNELLALIGRVEIDSQPGGALILVDGEEVGLTPLTERLVLGPGSYTLEARLEGHKSVQRNLRISAGDELKLLLELVSEGDSSTPAPALITAAPIAIPDKAHREFSISASFGTNTLQIANTGAPTLGAAYALSDRVSIGVDVVLVAYSAIPQLRYRLFGEGISMHLIAALPLNMSIGSESEFFVSGAGGAGVRYALHERIGLRLEALVSYAGSEHGLTLPAFLGAEVFF